MTSLLQPDDAGLDVAVAILRAGGLVAFGTETVYGLGADATQDRAVARIFQAKGRPHFNPLICHFPDAAAAFAEVVPTGAALALQTLWPGPLTLVLPRRVTCGVALLAGAGLDTLAVRVPAHPVARALAARLGRPIAAPSANRSGQISPVTAAHVLEELDGRIDAVVDCGPCAVGLESTVVDVTGGAVVLRPGGVPTDAIAAALGYTPGRAISPEEAQATRGLRSPGLMVSHYAPSVPVRLDAHDIAPDEALLAFGPPLPGAGAVFELSHAGDLTEAAARLFAGLRLLDTAARAERLVRIAVMPIPATGLGEAIRDRLARAAAPRD